MSVRKEAPRYCLECGADISHRGGQAKFCAECAEIRRRKLARSASHRQIERRRSKKRAESSYSDFDALSGKSITEIAVLARKANMSYGAYCAECRKAGRVI